MRGVFLILALGVQAAWSAALETPTLKVEFDSATGSLVKVGEKGAGTALFSANGGALWEAEFDGGLKLTEQALVNMSMYG